MITRQSATDPQAGARRRRRRRPEAPAAFASLLVPSGRRTCWWYLITCRSCRAPHLGRSPELDSVTGPRRLPCGHWVTVVVARTYGQQRADGAA